MDSTSTAENLSSDSFDKYMRAADAPRDPSRVKAAHIGVPSALCAQGIELVDTPGLSYSAPIQQLVFQIVGSADVVVFVLNGLQPFSQSELEFVERAYAILDNRLMFVLNRMDAVLPDERTEIVEAVQARIRVSFPQAVAHAVSARQAVDAAQSGESAMFSESGVPTFELSLAELLTHETVRPRLSRVALMIREQISTAKRILAAESNMSAKAAYELQKQQIQEKALAMAIADRISAEAEFTSGVAATMGTSFLRDIAVQLPRWAHDLSPAEASTTLNPMRTREQIEAVAREIEDQLAEKLSSEVSRWIRGELSDFIKSKVRALLEDLESELSGLIHEIDILTVSAIEVPFNIQRLGASRQGLGEASLSSPLAGAVMGSAILPLVGTAAGLAIGAAVGALGGYLRGGYPRIRDQVISGMRASIADNAEEFGSAISEGIREYYTGIQSQVAEFFRGREGALQDALNRVGANRPAHPDPLQQLLQVESRLEPLIREFSTDDA